MLIGGGSLAASLASRIAAEGLAGRVALIGEVPDAGAYLPQLDVLAMTSRHEGLPMVLLEAAAADLPVVAYDVGGVREILDDGPASRRIRDGDAAAFAAALAAMLSAARSRRTPRRPRRGARRVRDRFDAARTSAAYLSLYRGEPPAPQGA